MNGVPARFHLWKFDSESPEEENIDEQVQMLITLPSLNIRAGSSGAWCYGSVYSIGAYARSSGADSTRAYTIDAWTAPD